MLHSSTGFQPNELMFGHKASTICNAWLCLANYNDQYLPIKCTWASEQHDLIFNTKRCALNTYKRVPNKTLLEWEVGLSGYLRKYLLLQDPGASSYNSAV